MAHSDPAATAPKQLVFVWNNFGPMHADRVAAVAARFPETAVTGLELYDTDVTYSWVSDSRDSFDKVTLFQGAAAPGLRQRIRALIKAARGIGGRHWFLCHYERPEIFLLAIWLRLRGVRVYTMGCSKFDDMPRRPFREWIKSFYMWPYRGGLSTPARSADYLRFQLGPKRPVAGPYNTLSIDRMRAQAADIAVPAFDQRDWVIVARLVPKKNLSVALKAFALYRQAGGVRRLHLCGDGPLEADLKAEATALGIADTVVFHGFVQTQAISKILKQGLALILPSFEEQFGNVVIEAQALDLPVLLSDRCGAREFLVQDWVNGFSFPHDCAESLAGYMRLLDQDPDLYARLSDGARTAAPRCDVAAFADGVAEILKKT